MKKELIGTLAIDLGNTNTVLAFQSEIEDAPILIEIPNVTSKPGVIPTAIWYEPDNNRIAIGAEAFDLMNLINESKYFYSNFKRLIGNPCEKFSAKQLSPEESGKKFFRILWSNLPSNLLIKRLVLTAPIDTYRKYRDWLIGICHDLPIEEIALVDEPTAAAIGINVPFGSKIMILDIGGSTIDMNIVKIEGGEGRAAPMAELLKFNGEDVSKFSKQKLRCAEIISKTGCKIGGKDIDRWIANYFIPSYEDERNLIITEKLKCNLSSEKIKSEQRLTESLFVSKTDKKEFSFTKKEIEEILISNKLFNLLETLLTKLLNEARGKNCNSKDLHSIILVGGGTQIPIIRNWISKTMPELIIKYPPPIESVALGALSLTPGVKIKDILNKSIFIRLLNKRDKKHLWHPIFVKGQTWPTENPFELILQASKNEQNRFELVMGESKEINNFDIIFEDGIPKVSEIDPSEKISRWERDSLEIQLNKKVSLGEDCLKLSFSINQESFLNVECKDLDSNIIGVFNLGSIS